VGDGARRGKAGFGERALHGCLPRELVRGIGLQQPHDERHVRPVICVPQRQSEYDALGSFSEGTRRLGPLERRRPEQLAQILEQRFVALQRSAKRAIDPPLMNPQCPPSPSPARPPLSISRAMGFGSVAPAIFVFTIFVFTTFVLTTLVLTTLVLRVETPVLFDDQARAAAVPKIGQGPLKNDEHAILESRQIVDVDDQPGNPRRDSGEPESSRLKDCAASTDRGHLPLVAKAKVRMAATPRQRSDASREVSTLLERSGGHTG
jgi:hypothetical protein